MTKDDWWKKLIDLEIWWIKEVDLIYRFLGFWWWTYEQRDRLKIFCHFNVYPKIAWKIRNFCLISNSTIMQKCKNECWHQQHQDASIHSLHLLLQRHLLVLSRYYYGNMSIGSRILWSAGLFGCTVDLIYRCFGVLMMDIQTDLHYRDWKYLLVLSRYYYGNMSVSSRFLRSPGLFGCPVQSSTRYNWT